MCWFTSSVMTGASCRLGLMVSKSRSPVGVSTTPTRCPRRVQPREAGNDKSLLVVTVAEWRSRSEGVERPAAVEVRGAELGRHDDDVR